MSTDVIQVEIQRGSEKALHTEVFEVPAYNSQTVLDVVSWVQQHSDPTLSYRFACRVGSAALDLPHAYFKSTRR